MKKTPHKSGTGKTDRGAPAKKRLPSDRQRPPSQAPRPKRPRPLKTQKAPTAPIAQSRPSEPRAAAAPLHSDPRDLLAIYRPDLTRVLADLAAPSFRYDQVFEHLFRQPLAPFARSTVLPDSLRTALDRCGSSSLTVVESKTSRDRTTKLVLTATDGAAVEMVIMRYRSRVTACISSQVGCPVGCAFCATGRMGLERNLTAAEIVDQVRVAVAMGVEEGWRLSNLVYMGMGEPLLNLQAVLDSIRILTNPRALQLGHRSISISTVGIPAGMRRLARMEPQVNLALSLHSADDRTRARLVPERFRHPLDKIMAAAWDHFEITHRKLLVEYVLLEGVNDSVGQARDLAALLRGHVVTVNLLAWNPVASLAGAQSPQASGRSGFRASSPAAVTAFRDALLAAGVEAVVRQSKGTGIHAACGQLAGRSRPGGRSHRPPKE